MRSLAELDSGLADESARLVGLEAGERSVAAAFHLAHRRLPAEHQDLFGALARYPGADFDLAVVAALAGTDSGAAERALCDLVEANLVEAGARGRYRIHDLLKAIVRDTAPSDPAEQASLGRLLDLVVARLLAVDELLAPQRYRPPITGLDAVPAEFGFTGQDAALRWVAGEADTLDALVGVAADHGLHDRCWQLAFLLRTFYFLDKRWDSWVGTHHVAIAAAKASGNAWAEAVTHNNLGVALLDRGDREQAATHFRFALDLFGDLGDEHGLATTRAHLAWVSHYRGHHHTALNELTAALAFYRQHRAQRNEAITLRGIALVETALGRCSDAAAHAETAIELFEELGLDLDAAMAVNALAWAHYRHGRDVEAAQRYAEAGSRARRCGSDYEAARAATGSGNVHAAAGRLAQAELEWRRSDGLHSRLSGSDVGEARVREELRNSTA
ncbi:tetratricopeptide repeat protein [Amycolatopsis sp. NPDC048633]|uniref:tetratricopeptide repeat protein n=1 Tax=Amycolatopsis sp. NPDC048633 TaxID=3157095 RepID=UPI003403A7FA